MPRYNVTPIALLVAILLGASVANLWAQQPDASKFDQTHETAVAKALQPGATKSGQTYEAAAAKAQATCAALWADHRLDPLRDKIPLGEDNKPTSAMLANPDRLRADDKPVADLAIKMVRQCRAAWAPAWAMLPTATNFIMEGVQRKQDQLIADVYSGKILRSRARHRPRRKYQCRPHARRTRRMFDC
jgi:hypothetical protein